LADKIAPPLNKCFRTDTILLREVELIETETANDKIDKDRDKSENLQKKLEIL
jgi:hypothetical protein